ncbi:Nitrilase family, member 2 [Seminavis robusta]|uniref:Nitrilase family, member 2 n=1 Tax=Seminavis robusta TaxID=568900 RepID=A0A9N8HFX4_9STRA|nr:Nitrilase family, member 2 [Seminavis robusta]|eukprot:Sro545_g163860.1 Nitrilase family, member 2 (500) ;mRNA; r:27092-29268
MNRSDFEGTSNCFNNSSSGTSSYFVGSLGMNPDRTAPSDSHEDGPNKNDKQAMVPLHLDFVPGPNDVICGRGKKCYAHTGNERFRQIVQSYLDRYQAAASRPEKSEILSSIVSQVRESSPDGGFVKQDATTNQWFEVGDFLAREKTSQAFRDALAEHYRSSKKAKHEKRRQRTQAKALIEKQATMLPSLDTGSGHGPSASLADNQQSLFPSPLVSRQHLTVLREDPPHPRAFSFSGHTHERLAGREVRSRAMSLSAGGHFGDRNDVDLSAGGNGPCHGEGFHRPDSAPGRYYGRGDASSVDDLAEIDLRQGLGRRMESSGHESWPQHSRSQTTRTFFNPPASLYATQPQFHPVRAEDLAGHRTFQGNDALMTAVDNARVHGEPSHVAQWTNNSIETEVRASQQQGNDLQFPASFASESPRIAYLQNSGGASMGGLYPSGSATTSNQPPEGIHQRTDSTASATVIVAQLASALHQDSPNNDENPFEPIPLGGRSKKKAKR